MSAHTPGPWHQGGLETKDEHYMRDVRAADGSSTAWCGRYPAKEAHANARLIAAAPELLDALLEARKQLESYEAELSGERYNSPMINAAIAKATGADHA